MKRKGLWLMLALAGAFACAAYIWQKIDERASRPFVYTPETGYSYGSINGVPLKLPKRETFLIDYGYADGSDLPDAESRTCNSPIQSVTLFLRWPGLVPVGPDNYHEFQTTKRKSLGYTQWLDIGFGNAGTRPTRLKSGANYLHAVRDMWLDLDTGGGRLPWGMRFQYYPADDVVRLPNAVPVGPQSSERDLWNRHVYWDAHEESKTVNTLIECGGGQYEPPHWVPRCTQYFHLPEMQMDVRVSYTNQLLPEWKSIQRAVAEHMRTYASTCAANRETSDA